VDAPLLDDVVEAVGRLLVLKVLGEVPLAAADGLAELLGERLVLAQLVEDGLVEEVLDVLGVVERRRGRRALVGLLAVLGLARVDACARG